MKTYQIELTGRSALLMHADDVEAADLLDEWRKDSTNRKSSKAGDDRSPAWTWMTYLYHDAGAVAMPSANLMVSLRQAGAQIILKKQKTFKEISQSGMSPDAEFLTFEVLVGGKWKPVSMADVAAIREEPFRKQAEAVKAMGFKLDVRRARVGQAKHVRVRPRFDSWRVRGSLTVSATAEITEERLAEMFSIAGRGGLGDWRAACRTPGMYGMYEAKISG